MSKAYIMIFLILLAGCSSDKMIVQNIGCNVQIVENRNKVINQDFILLDKNTYGSVNVLEINNIKADFTITKQSVENPEYGDQLIVSIYATDSKIQLLSQNFTLPVNGKFSNTYINSFTGKSWVPYNKISDSQLVYWCSVLE
jgi:hypothetical protein